MGRWIERARAGRIAEPVVTPNDIDDITTEAALQAEVYGWRAHPDGTDWVETPERAAACVFCLDPLALGDLLACAEHRARLDAASS